MPRSEEVGLLAAGLARLEKAEMLDETLRACGNT
jgi:hypothetical protein